MSTPTVNSVPTTLLSTAGLDPNVASLIEGRKWGGTWGTGVNLDISFPTDDLSGNAFFDVPYGGFANTFRDNFTGYGEFYSWGELSPTEENAVINGLLKWSAVANINFSRVQDTISGVGDLRFARTTVASDTSGAHAYTPDDFTAAGDVWFKTGSWHTSGAITPGTYDYLTIIHEIGHALGLKHPFESPRVINPEFDSYSFSIMSYSATTDLPSDNDATFYPTTPMWYDLLAIQQLYGARPHNAGNTTYTYVSGNNYWETIDDSGGIDTIRHIGTDAARIDLRIGFWSDLGRSIFFTGAPNQSDTVMTGPRSVIENAIGGNGSDVINGNNLNNKLTGNSGDDLLRGFGGNDVMSAGAGFDVLDGGTGNDSYNGGAGKDSLKGGPGFDSFIFNSALTTFDTISGYSVAQDVIRLAGSIFTGIGPTLTANEFGRGAVATGVQHILYLPGTGQLFFDPDGGGGNPAVQFARLGAGLAINAGEFLMI